MKKYRPMYRKGRKRIENNKKRIKVFEYSFKYKTKVILIFINNAHYISINISHIDEHKLLYIFSIIIRQLNLLDREVSHKDIINKINIINQTHDIFCN